MRKRPRELFFFSLLLIGIGLSFPFQIWLQLDEVPLSFLFSRQAYTPLNLLVIASALVHALMVYQASRLLFITGGLFTLLVSWNNWIVAELDVGTSPFWAGLAVIGVLSLHLVLLKRSVRQLLLQPQLRWWKTAPRTRVAVQAVVYPVLGGELQSRTFDVSMGGAFVSAAALPKFEVGHHCSVRLKLDSLNMLNCTAQVVRRAKDAGQYPEGYGLKFVGLSSDQKKLLQGFLNFHQAPLEPSPAL